MKPLLRLLLAFVLLATGCGGGEAAPPEGGPITIAVVPKGTTHEFWKSVHAGAEKAAQETGVQVIWKGPLKEDDRDGQIAVMEDMISRGVSGIVLAPLDDAALRAPVSSATRSDIPVVIIDSDLQGSDFISFIATENYRGGQLAGEHMARLLGGTGKVLVLRYAEGSASTSQRERGFMEEIAKHPGIEVVSSNQYGGATTESAYRASENLLGPHRSQGALTVQGIFTPNESTTFGMLRALQDAGLAGKVRFVGFDSSPKLVEALQAGQLDGLMIQNPMGMGYEGVRTMVAHLKGEPVEKRIDTGVTLVTRENMEEPEVKERLSPDLSRWLN